MQSSAVSDADSDTFEHSAPVSDPFQKWARILFLAQSLHSWDDIPHLRWLLSYAGP